MYHFAVYDTVERAEVCQMVSSLVHRGGTQLLFQQLDRRSAEERLVLVSVDATPGLAATAPLLLHSFHRIPHDSSGSGRKPAHIPVGIGSERTGRRKRAKGSRILNHTLHVSQPDVQRESCGVR